MMTMPSQMLSKFMIGWGILLWSSEFLLFIIKHHLRLELLFRGGMHFMASNNDCGIREYDMEKFQLLNDFQFPWPVNVSHLNNLIACCGFLLGKVSLYFFMWSWLSLQHTSISPDRRVVAVVGDHVDAFLMDSQNGKVTIFSFACCLLWSATYILCFFK